MAAEDWYDVKYLESTTNVREALHRSFGRKPNATIARGIAIALQQGRLFFEAAGSAPIEIRPLLVYYGVLSFARALTAAVRNVKLDDLAHAHGLSDIGTPTSIENLRLRCSGNGTFQEFNNAIAPLSRLHFYENSMPTHFPKPFDGAKGLDGQEITLADILSRTPALAKAFSKTFGCASNCLAFDLTKVQGPRWQLRIDDPRLVTDRESLRKLVDQLRASYPFLQNWQLLEVTVAWGNSILVFDNRTGSGNNDLDQSELIDLGDGTFRNSYEIRGSGEAYTPPTEMLPPLSGGYEANAYPCAVKPIGNCYINDYSIQFLGTFMLGSLVRYRPQIWQHALSKSVTAELPADDRPLSVVEQFIDEVLRSFPRLAVNIMTTTRVPD